MADGRGETRGRRGREDEEGLKREGERGRGKKKEKRGWRRRKGMEDLELITHHLKTCSNP